LHPIIDKETTQHQLSRQAEELAKRNLELDAFAHTTAHQIQGLLGQIIGYASYMEMNFEDKLGAEGRDVLSRILRSGNKMSNVVSELLLLSHVDKEDVPLIPFNMELIVAEARKRLSFITQEHQAQFIQPKNWPTIIGYPGWIEEAWVNFISNAIKYGGTPPIVELGWQENGDGMILFWVQDNGEGINDSEQKQLFKRHSRLLKIDVKGEGLGLFIVQQIIHKCQGEVGVESSPGTGSRFWFSLPAENNKPDESPPAA
jgi:signal transduction histidine kinase